MISCCCGIVLCLCFACETPDTSSQKETAKTPANSDNINMLLDIAIDKALDYFKQRTDSIEFGSAVVLHYLYRKFDLPAHTKFSDKLIQNETDDRALALYRLVNKDHTVSEKQLGEFKQGESILVNLHNVTYMMNRSLYCDVYPFEEQEMVDFFELIKNQINADRYFLTHAALSLKWLSELECLNQATVDSLIGQCVESINKLVEKTNDASDLHFEAMAFLFYIDDNYQFNTKQLPLILNNQNSDGGWSYKVKTNAKSTDHASVHALWVLLELRYPNKTPIKWIPI